MDARPVLALLARVFEQCGLEAILIGNAAAAVQGAPVTTLDLDSLFRKSPRNLAKLKAVAKALGAVILRPYYPASDLYRLVRDDDGLQVDFMAAIHGVRSFESLRSRAWRLDLDGSAILVAWLTWCAASVPPAAPEIARCWRFWRGPSMKGPRATLARQRKLDALRRESDLALRDQIRRLLALPPDQRTHFLRKKIGFQASCL